MPFGILYDSIHNELAGWIHCTAEEEFTLTEEANPGVMVLPIPQDHEFIRHQDRWYAENGTLFRKTELLITADKTTFSADGLDFCEITVTPPTNTTVTINQGARIAVSDLDNTIRVTSDMPKDFSIVVHDRHFFSNELNVSAT